MHTKHHTLHIIDSVCVCVLMCDTDPIGVRTSAFQYDRMIGPRSSSTDLLVGSVFVLDIVELGSGQQSNGATTAHAHRRTVP